MIIGEKLSLSHRGEGEKDVKRLFLEMLPSIVEISILNISFASQNDCEFESRLISKLLGICESVSAICLNRIFSMSTSITDCGNKTLE